MDDIDKWIDLHIYDIQYVNMCTIYVSICVYVQYLCIYFNSAMTFGLKL